MPDADPGLPAGAPRSHLAPFSEGLRPWLVLARNAIPVVGVHALGWSAGLAVFQIWFDGMAALGAMIALHMRAFVLTDPKASIPADIPAGAGLGARLLVLSLAWLVLFALLGIPYWFALLFLGAGIPRLGIGISALGDPIVLVALLFVLISHIAEQFRRGYERMSATEARLEFNWDFSMHLTRIAALLLVAFFSGGFIIIPLAIALSYVEIYPMRALRLFGGERTLEAGNRDRSRD